MDSGTDAQLLTALRAGDEQAFVTLVRRHHDAMLRLASSFVPNVAVAEEVVQDTWVGVLRGIDGFEGRSSFRTWLFRILVNRARTAGARERRTIADRRRYEAHLAGCPHCTEYLAQMRKTIELTGTLTPDDLTPQMQDDFIALYRQWRADRSEDGPQP